MRRLLGLGILIGAVVAGAACDPRPARAQAPRPRPDSGQVVGLFDQSCIRHAGDTAGLRAWIALHGLPQAPPAQAAPFLGSMGDGEVFGASNASGKHALVSYESGACKVIALSGDAADIQQTMLTLLRAEGVVVTRLLARSKADGSSSQTMFEAEGEGRRWLLSITAKPHADGPEIAPEVTLLATAGPRRSPGGS